MRPKSLAGKTILVTRPRARLDPLTQALKSAGAKVVAIPAIRIAAPSSYASLDRALRALSSYDAAAFTSARAVEAFFARGKFLRLKPLPKPRRLWAVGPETARSLSAHGWPGARRAKAFHGKALARSMGKVHKIKILIPRAQAGGEDLPAILRKKGAIVDLAECYRAVPDKKGLARISKIRSNGAAAVAFASGSSVESFVKRLGLAASRKFFKKAAAAAIGPVTAQALRRYGIPVRIQAEKSTARGLARAIAIKLGARNISPRSKINKIPVRCE